MGLSVKYMINKFPTAKHMVNLGCGDIGHDDWVNIDCGILALVNKHPWLKKVIFSLRLAPASYQRPWPKNLYFVNLRKKFPLADSSLDYIYSSHFIEHIKTYEAIALFSQCYRALKPGAVMRITVPDLDLVTQQYLADPDPIHRAEVINDHFWGLLAHSNSAPSFHDKILAHFARGHQWLYNYEYFKKILVLAGFDDSKITKCAYRQGQVPNLDFLDRHADHTLYVEVTK